jgi:Holliday junction resolvase RusA-like endonuclease
MKGVVWNDDNQVVIQRNTKFYADNRPPGVQVMVRFMKC